jgi:hypothetical protein
MENSVIVFDNRRVEGASNSPAEIQQVAGELEQLRNEMVDLVNDHVPTLAGIELEKRPSASNLLHYLAFRPTRKRSGSILRKLRVATGFAA